MHGRNKKLNVQYMILGQDMWLNESDNRWGKVRYGDEVLMITN